MQFSKIFTTFLILSFFLTIKSNANNNLILEQQGTEYLAFSEKMPEPVGGLAAIYSQIKYPESALRAGVQGKVYALAFINEEGGVDDVKIVKGIGSGCDQATIDAVKKTKFSPGISAGKPAKVKMSLQIQFEIK